MGILERVGKASLIITYCFDHFAELSDFNKRVFQVRFEIENIADLSL